MKGLLNNIREEQGLSYARIVHEKIIHAVNNLEEFPLLGITEPALAHKKSEYRYIIVWSLKIIYKVEMTKITISRIFHTSQNPRKLKGV